MVSRPIPQNERIFMSLDMDAFYCGVEEHYDPSLIDEPFAVVQKNIVCSVSYAARNMGIKKLLSVLELRRNFPEVRLINGESLAKYRKAGFELFEWVKAIIGDAPIERLGLEEMKIEITDVVKSIVANLEERGVFNGEVPEEGGEGIDLEFFNANFRCSEFFFEFSGKTYPPDCTEFVQSPDLIPPHFYVAGHLACYLKERMLIEKGYKCSIGVGSSKSIAKMAVSMNKPNGISVIVGGHEHDYLQTKPLRDIPGFGHKLRLLLAENFQLPEAPTVADLHKIVSKPDFLTVGTEHLWELSFGRESLDITPYTVPSQVSVEDTFLPFLPAANVPLHLYRLIDSLLDQVLTDLVKDNKWLAKPSHFRLQIATGYTPRKSKTQKIILLEKDDIAQQVKGLKKALDRLSVALLQQLAPKEVRLINVALSFLDQKTVY